MSKPIVLILGNPKSGKTTAITTATRGSQPTVRDGAGRVTVDITLLPGNRMRLEVQEGSTVELCVEVEDVRALLVRVATDPTISGILAAMQPVDSSKYGGMEQWVQFAQEIGLEVRAVLIDLPYMGGPPTSFHKSPEGIRRRLRRFGVELAAVIDGRLPPETHVALIHRLLAA